VVGQKIPLNPSASTLDSEQALRCIRNASGFVLNSGRDFSVAVTGIEDAWPVVAEPYRQWVLEDDFCNGRPAWELVGVQSTSDVSAFERMKVRLLNGSHFAMAYPAALLGFEFRSRGGFYDPQRS
jgi:hypothetical protein